jgi:phosphatidate cytidylyltransferase
MLGLRAATAAVLLAVFGSALAFSSGPVWLGFCCVVLAAAAWEWGRLARLSSVGSCVLVAAAIVAVYFLSATTTRAWTQSAYLASLAFWVLAVPLWLARRPQPPGSVLALCGLIVLVPAFAALVTLRELGIGLLLSVMAIAWVSDTAAYLVGRKIGRRKLAPAISPGKSWEGFWGAMVAVACYASLVLALAPGALERAGVARPMAVLPAAIALAVLGVMGDLFESQLKRAAGVKDSGRVLPGHGGVLDRVDALLPVLPAAAWLLGVFGQ